MKLDLKPCDRRVFDKRTGKVICRDDKLEKSDEDCMECMQSIDYVESPRYTKAQVIQMVSECAEQINMTEKYFLPVNMYIQYHPLRAAIITTLLLIIIAFCLSYIIVYYIPS